MINAPTRTAVDKDEIAGKEKGGEIVQRNGEESDAWADVSDVDMEFLVSSSERSISPLLDDPLTVPDPAAVETLSKAAGARESGNPPTAEVQSNDGEQPSRTQSLWESKAAPSQKAQAIGFSITGCTPGSVDALSRKNEALQALRTEMSGHMREAAERKFEHMEEYTVQRLTMLVDELSKQDKHPARSPGPSASPSRSEGGRTRQSPSPSASSMSEGGPTRPNPRPEGAMDSYSYLNDITWDLHSLDSIAVSSSFLNETHANLHHMRSQLAIHHQTLLRLRTDVSTALSAFKRARYLNSRAEELAGLDARLQQSEYEGRREEEGSRGATEAARGGDVKGKGRVEGP